MYFSHPLFLWALPAILIPLIIHLINIRRYRKIYFSNTDTLKEIYIEQRQHRRINHWLILLARTLAILFLVLAFAQPKLGKRGQDMQSGDNIVSIYIDNTLSMDQSSAEGSMLDMARQKAREIAEAYSVSDRFQLITADLLPSQSQLLSRDELYERLDQVETTPASPLMSGIIQRQLDFLKQYTHHNISSYIISDFQQSTTDLFSFPVDSNVHLTMVPLQGNSIDNIYIDTFMFDAPAFFVGGNVNVSVKLCNTGQHDVEKVPVKLLLEGHERAIASVDIPANGSIETTMRFALDHAGYIDGLIAIEDYPIVFDDHRWFSIRVNDQKRVFELYGSAQNEYIGKLFSSDSTIVHTSGQYLPSDLSNTDLLVLNETKSLSSGEIEQIGQWIAEGGSLLAIPSPDHSPSSLNALLASAQAPQLNKWLAHSTRVNLIDDKASLYEGVFSSRNENDEMPTIKGHYTLSPSVHVAQPVMMLADGSPLLTITPHDKGIIYLFTTPLRAEHNSLVNQALFVPTIYNMALYSRFSAPIDHIIGSRNPIYLLEPHDIGHTPPELHGPNGFQIIPDIRQVGTRQMLILHGEPTDDGIYTLDNEHLALNRSRLESQMLFYTPDELGKFTHDTPCYTILRHTEKTLTEALLERNGGHSLWQLCLVLMLAMLACETILIKMKR